MALSIKCSAIASSIAAYILPAVLDVNVRQHHGVQVWCNTVCSFGKGIPVILVYEHHHGLVVTGLVAANHLLEFIPVGIVADYEATIAVISHSCGVIELHYVLLVVPGFGTLHESIGESRQCQSCGNDAHGIARAGIPSPQRGGAAAHTIGHGLVFITVEQCLVLESIGVFSFGELVLHGYCRPTLVVGVCAAVHIALDFKVVAVIKVFLVCVVHFPSEQHLAVRLYFCRQVLRKVHHLRCDGIRRDGDIFTLAVFQFGSDENVFPRTVSRQIDHIYQFR